MEGEGEGGRAPPSRVETCRGPVSLLHGPPSIRPTPYVEESFF